MDARSGPTSNDVEDLVKGAMPVVSIAARQLKRQTGCPLAVEELESFGHEGLLQAARSFDPSRGVPFRRWANLRIKGAMIDGIRASGVLPRRVYQQVRALESVNRMDEAKLDDSVEKPSRASPEEADAKLGSELSDLATAAALALLTARSEGMERAPDLRPSPEELVAHKLLIDKVRSAIQQLPKQERTLLLRHYFEDATFEQAAKELGLSKSWASRIHARAVESLTKTLRSLG